MRIVIVIVLFIAPYSPKGGIGLNTTKCKMMFTIGRIQSIRKCIAFITVVNEESLSFF